MVLVPLYIWQLLDLFSLQHPTLPNPIRHREESAVFDMGLRSWFRRFVSKVKEVLGIYDKYDDFECEAYFDDGSVFTYTGHPWGSAFEEFKRYAASNANAVRMNMSGSFWSF